MELILAGYEGRLGRYACSIQIDISKMFDRVRHHKLALAAEWAGFPMWLLRATLPAYRWPRTLVLPEGIAGARIDPKLGSVPRSAFEVAALLTVQVVDFLPAVGFRPA